MLDVFKRIFYNKNNIYDVESTVARVNFYWFVKINSRIFSRNLDASSSKKLRFSV